MNRKQLGNSRKKPTHPISVDSSSKSIWCSFSVRLEAKTLRKSTSVKRVELEKRQKERQERRDYVKGVASLRNTREVRKLTQEELLEEAKITGKVQVFSSIPSQSFLIF